MKTIQDMTVDELEQLIEEKILEASKDPDKELELREEVIKTLQQRRENEANITHDEIL